jgi:hypothetical protein
VAGRSRAWVCGQSLAGTAGSNLGGGRECLWLVIVVCHLETSRMRRSWPDLCRSSDTGTKFTEVILDMCIVICVNESLPASLLTEAMLCELLVTSSSSCIIQGDSRINIITIYFFGVGRCLILPPYDCTGKTVLHL